VSFAGAHFVELFVSFEVLLDFVLGRLLPPFGRRHFGRVPLSPLGAPVLEPNLPTKEFIFQFFRDI